MSDSSTFPKGLAVCTAVALVGLMGLLVSLIGWEPNELYLNAAGESEHGPHYAFYDLSGNPLEPLSPPQTLTSSTQIDADESTLPPPSVVASTESAPQEIETWTVQAGAFQNSLEADARRAELLLLGLNAHIETGADQDGIPWHRVLIGPIESDNQLESTQLILSEAQIDQMTRSTKRAHN